MIQDLRSAARMLLREKGWTTVVLLLLALGIGANTTLFIAINGLLLRPLPVEDPESLVRFRWSGDHVLAQDIQDRGISESNAAGVGVHNTFSYPMFRALREANNTLIGVLASGSSGQVRLTIAGVPEVSLVQLVSGNYFQVLGIQAEIGRTILPEDDQASAAPVGLITYRYWVSRFGRNPDVIGTVIEVQDIPVTIVGVMPREFTGIQNLVSPDSMENIAIPLTLDPQIQAGRQEDRLASETMWWLWLMGRLKPGVTMEQASANLDGTFSPDGASRLEMDSGSRGIWDPFPNDLQSAKLLSVVVGLVLLICCANVANLLLSRAAARQHEVFIRLSVGASRLRLLRMFLTESVLIALLGGALGLLAGYWSRALMPFGGSQPLDWRVLGFTALLSFGAGIVSGIVPAMRAMEPSRWKPRTFAGNMFLGVQVAISIVLLITAGLLLRTVHNLQDVDIGFEADRLTLLTASTSLSGYGLQRRTEVHRRIQEDLLAIPGVDAVSRSSNYLLSGSIAVFTVYFPGRPGGSLSALSVSPEFFETMGIPLVHGRGFSDGETIRGAAPVVIINETAARELFPGEDPIGKRFGYAADQNDTTEVVGVVKDTKYSSLREAGLPVMFRPMVQSNSGHFIVRSVNPPSIGASIAHVIRNIDPELPFSIHPYGLQVANRYARERFFAVSYACFGGLALLVASTGLFGLISYSVARRRNEVGIRMALGARAGDVVRMVIQESLRIVLIGIAVGIAAALAAGRLIASLLFGVQPADAITIAAAAIIMLAVSTFAGYLPARRASRIDPCCALRHD